MAEEGEKSSEDKDKAPKKEVVEGKKNRVKYKDEEHQAENVKETDKQEEKLKEAEKVFSKTTLKIIGPKSSQSAISLQLNEIMRRGSFSFLYPGMEGDLYDFSSERTNAHSRIIPSIVHIVKGSLGCGFLCIHEAWKFCGIWTSLIVALLITCLARNSYRMIGHSAQKTYEKLRVPHLSYPQLAEAALTLGPLHCNTNLCRRARHFMNVWIFLKIMGTLCVYEIIMAKTLKHSLEYFSPKISLSIRAYILIIVLPLVLLSMIRNLRILVILATVADFYIIICIGITIYQTMLSPEIISTLPVWRSAKGLFQFSAVFAYAIDGSYSILPTENHMSKPRYIFIVTDIGLIITAVFVAGLGFIGYWGWGDKCEAPFTIHMSSQKAFMVIQLVLVGFLAMAFTIHLFVPFEILWHYATKKFSWVKRYPRGARAVITAQVVLISCTAVVWPYATDVIAFLGIVCSAWLLFIVPAVIESFIYWEERKQSRFGMALHSINLFYVIFGLCIFFGGLTSYIQSSLRIQITS